MAENDSPDYKAGYEKGKFDADLTAYQERLREQDAKAAEDAGVIDTPNGVFRPSDDSGVLITVTQPSDPAYQLIQNPSISSTPTVYRRGCFICEDPEFAQMGLPLCKPCPKCGGHVAADDTVCDDCGTDTLEDYLEEKAKREQQDQDL